MVYALLFGASAVFVPADGSPQWALVSEPGRPADLQAVADVMTRMIAEDTTGLPFTDDRLVGVVIPALNERGVPVRNSKIDFGGRSPHDVADDAAADIAALSGGRGTSGPRIPPVIAGGRETAPAPEATVITLQEVVNGTRQPVALLMTGHDGWKQIFVTLPPPTMRAAGVARRIRATAAPDLSTPPYGPQFVETLRRDVLPNGITISGVQQIAVTGPFTDFVNARLTAIGASPAVMSGTRAQIRGAIVKALGAQHQLPTLHGA